MHGRRDLKDMGSYRTEEDAMQVVSGALHAPEVHLKRLLQEMCRARWRDL